VIRRRPGEGRYARVEREQRWILGGLPEDITEPVEIHDRYLNDSTLRLRQARLGSEVVYKLGQKVRVVPGSPELVSITNLYLTRHEFDSLAALAGSPLYKIRWHWPNGDRVISVDQFRGSLEGLILAEVELSEDDSDLATPPLALADVTKEDRFSGGHLAHLSAKEVAALPADVAELRRLG